MAEIVPTINALNIKEFEVMLNRVTSFAGRVHIDICDGEFADGHTPSLAQVYVPENKIIDLHLMLKHPGAQFENAVSLKPNLIIYHAESADDITDLVLRTKALGINAGIAILPETSVESAKEVITIVDHVLIFTGHLGHNGGVFQQNQLEKVKDVRQINPGAEISVDGGVNASNAQIIIRADVDVLFAGAYIHSAKNPNKAFETLIDLAAEIELKQ